MSSAVVSTSAALGRRFIFDEPSEAEVCPLTGDKKPSGKQAAMASVFESTINHQKSKLPAASITPASRLEIRPAPEMAPSGVSAIDALTGGLPRGCLTEIFGPASSGRTSVLLAALAAATRRGEYCAVIDASDALDAQSTADAGVELDRLLWVRCGESSPHKNNSPLRHRDTEKDKNEENQGCPILVPRVLRDRVGTSPRSENSAIPRASEHRLEQVLRATDLLLESGGFSLIVLDLADIPLPAARRIPLTTWFRFRRAVENKSTILLAVEQQPIAGSCSTLLLQLGAIKPTTTQERKPSHSHLLTGLEITVELVRSRLERKPARSVTFETKTAWAG